MSDKESDSLVLLREVSDELTTGRTFTDSQRNIFRKLCGEVLKDYPDSRIARSVLERIERIHADIIRGIAHKPSDFFPEGNNTIWLLHHREAVVKWASQNIGIQLSAFDQEVDELLNNPTVLTLDALLGAKNRRPMPATKAQYKIKLLQNALKEVKSSAEEIEVRTVHPLLDYEQKRFSDIFVTSSEPTPQGEEIGQWVTQFALPYIEEKGAEGILRLFLCQDRNFQILEKEIQSGTLTADHLDTRLSCIRAALLKPKNQEEAAYNASIAEVLFNVKILLANGDYNIRPGAFTMIPKNELYDEAWQDILAELKLHDVPCGNVRTEIQWNSPDNFVRQMEKIEYDVLVALQEYCLLIKKLSEKLDASMSEEAIFKIAMSIVSDTIEPIATLITKQYIQTAIPVGPDNETYPIHVMLVLKAHYKELQKARSLYDRAFLAACMKEIFTFMQTPLRKS